MTVQPSRAGDDTTSEAPDLFAVSEGEMQRSTHTPELQPGFGSRLRAVREARSLDIETCGQALHLPVRVLRQIESDDRSGIDYQVYLAGYLRKYGRYLGIDNADIDAEIARSKRSDAIQESPALVVTGGISHSRYLLDRYVKAATYIVLTVVFAVPTIYLGMHGTLNSDMSHLASLDATPVAQKDAVASITGVKNAKQPVATLPVPAVKPPQVDQPLMASMMPVPDLAGDVNTVVHPVPPAASSVGDGDHSLQLTLSNSSWVEVTDADGHRLEYALLPAGTVRTYRSNESLDVRIGNANGAQASIDGQSVSLEDYRHANVAHFRVAIQDGKAQPAGA